MDTSPEAAAFFLNKDLAKYDKYKDGNYYRWLNEKALRTMIYTGQFDPHLYTYWSFFKSQQAPYWFDIDFAIPATEWAANNADNYVRLKSQKLLIEYYREGCPEYVMADPKAKTSLPVLFGSCSPNKNKMKEAFINLVSDDEINQSKKFYTAYSIGEKYFREEKYEDAASWYLAAITLSSNDKIKIIERDTSIAVNILFYSGLPIHEALEKAAIIMVSAYDNRVNSAKKRVELIANSGVKSLPVIALN